jgi:hypothetical protein
MTTTPIPSTHLPTTIKPPIQVETREEKAKGTAPVLLHETMTTSHGMHPTTKPPVIHKLSNLEPGMLANEVPVV